MSGVMLNRIRSPDLKALHIVSARRALIVRDVFPLVKSELERHKILLRLELGEDLPKIVDERAIAASYSQSDYECRRGDKFA